MTTINSTSSNLYSLLNQNSASSGASAMNSVSSLAEALAGNASSSSSADSVNLSEDAQNYLSSLGGASSSSSETASGFVLNPKQQQQISDILAKYKDAPFNEDTYNKIQADLKAAGLSPEQLALQDKMQKFNPTQILMDALNGKEDTSASLGTDDATEKANSDSYTNSILKQWKTISTTASAAATDSGTGSSTAA